MLPSQVRGVISLKTVSPFHMSECGTLLKVRKQGLFARTTEKQNLKFTRKFVDGQSLLLE